MATAEATVPGASGAYPQPNHVASHHAALACITPDHRAGYGSSSSDSSSAFGWIGVEITYLPEAQFPRSISRQRSLQNGASGSVALTGFWQIGHFILPGSEQAPGRSESIGPAREIPTPPAPHAPAWHPDPVPFPRAKSRSD